MVSSHLNPRFRDLTVISSPTDVESNMQEEIVIDMGVGIYDVKNPDFKESDFMPQSTTPWLILNKDVNAEGDDEDSDSSDSSGSD